MFHTHLTQSFNLVPCCRCSVMQLCPTLCDPMDCSTPGLFALRYLRVSSNSSTESVMPPTHLILCRPLLLPPSIFPSIRVFPKESALRIRCPKYWSFSFSISPSNEYLALCLRPSQAKSYPSDPHWKEEPTLTLCPLLPRPLKGL